MVDGDQDGAIDGWSIFTLIVFFLTNIIVIAPFHVPIPHVIWSNWQKLLVRLRILDPASERRTSSRKRLKLDYSTAPLIAVLVLLATKSIGGDEVRKGIVGSDGVEPYNIMCLFISLAYISISLDATGLLRFLAFWVAQRGGNSGRVLYLYLYVFFLLYGILVGNDPVILSGTPFLAYLTRVTGMAPIAWIFAEFAACNMASAVLVSSNITNLVLTGAYSLSFVTFTANTILPFLASCTLVFPVLMFITFRSPSAIPRTIHPPDVDPQSALVDKNGAIFGSILLVTTLVVLVSTSAAGLRVAVWQVTVPAAVVMFARDTAHDLKLAKAFEICLGLRRRKKSMNGTLSDVVHQSERNAIGTVDEPPMEISDMARDAAPSDPDGTSTPPLLPTGSALHPIRSLASHLHYLSLNVPTVASIAKRLPLPLLPFAFSMFTLVQGIGATGWLAVFSGWWAAWAEKTSVVGVVFGMGLISVILCNFCGTNIGATILLARILQTWTAEHSPPTRQSVGALYALALGSNYGAFSTTFPASLAGLLWRGILRQKGIEVRTLQFARLNLLTITTAMAVGCSVLVAQLYVAY